MFECKKHDEEGILHDREYGRKVTDLYELFLNRNEYQLKILGSI